MGENFRFCATGLAERRILGADALKNPGHLTGLVFEPPQRSIIRKLRKAGLTKTRMRSPIPRHPPCHHALGMPSKTDLPSVRLAHSVSWAHGRIERPNKETSAKPTMHGRLASDGRNRHYHSNCGLISAIPRDLQACRIPLSPASWRALPTPMLRVVQIAQWTALPVSTRETVAGRQQCGP